MKCPDCRAENVPGTEFCRNCGGDLHTLPLERSSGNELVDALIRHRISDVDPDRAVRVKPADSVASAVHIMQQEKVAAVLVVERDRLTGVLTERDILLKASDEKTDLTRLPVDRIMTHDPVVLRATDTLAVALHKMSVGGFRTIPIVDDQGKPVGILSADRVFRYVTARLAA
jgi:CBS domain-containing protein